AQVGLQALDPRRHVGLHAVQAVGGPGHPAGLGHRLEQRQVGQLQAAFSDRDGIVHNDSFYVLARLRQAGRWRCAMPLATVLTERLGLSHPIVQAPLAGGGDTPALVAAVAEAGALGFIGAAYPMPAAALDAVKARGMFVMGTASTVEEALALERTGVDAVVVQGAEAGGHRATFATGFEEGMVGTIALVPQVVDAVRVPVVASGGI